MAASTPTPPDAPNVTRMPPPTRIPTTAPAAAPTISRRRAPPFADSHERVGNHRAAAAPAITVAPTRAGNAWATVAIVTLISVVAPSAAAEENTSASR